MSQQEETLFGVEHGALIHYAASWSVNHETRSQVLHIVLGWANRKPTDVFVHPLEEQGLGHYVALWNDVTINGSWHSKHMIAAKARKAVERCREGGARVYISGTPLPRAYKGR